MKMNDELETPQWSLPDEKEKVLETESEVITSHAPCMKSYTLLNYIKENLKAADLKWSLFCAACNSYRFDSVLKPFPPFYILQEDKKQIDRLREVIELCPSMTILLKQLAENAVVMPLLDLLYWVLIQLKEPFFKLIPKEKHQDIICKVSLEMTAAMPDHMFSVTYGSRHQQKFAQTSSNLTTKLAFHGSRLDNFYSIVNHGLQVSLNKVAAFGPGIYLSSEMGLSLSYSPRGFTWASCSFGNYISVVALCEVIDHPEVKTEYDSKESTIFYISDKQSIPGKYFIVENNDLVRIRYLLVYSSEEHESVSLVESRTLLGWIRRHKMFTFVTAYVIFLLGIGSSNSSILYKFYRRLLRSLDMQ